MSKKNGNILAIGICFFLFAMISFVTGLQNPMGLIVKNQFEVSNAMSQLGNLANFIAYAFLGLPAGFILKRKGYKFTALAAVTVGFVGVAISFLSGVVESFGVYLLGAFVSGFSMCMLNTVVNPMLNTLGGGGNKGNQLIQFAGSCNSLAATIVPVFVGYLMGDAAKASIQDANPALFIAMGVFALAFVILFFSHIPEPELEAAKANQEKEEGTMSLIKGALSYRHFVFGIIAIFLYVGIEVGVPNTVNNYLTTKNKAQLQELVDSNAVLLSNLKAVELAKTDPTVVAPVLDLAKLYEDKDVKEKTPVALQEKLEKENEDAIKKIDDPEYQEGKGMDASTAGAVAGIYWLFMLVGRLIGGAVGAKVSSRLMVGVVSGVALVFLTIGILLPETMVSFPSVTSQLSFSMTQLPLGVVLFVLCGLCTSVMWGAIFNLAVEGLGKYTSIASGLFMVMVCGGGIVPFIQGSVADAAGFMTSFWVLVVAVAFILWYALSGSKIKK